MMGMEMADIAFDKPTLSGGASGQGGAPALNAGAPGAAGATKFFKSPKHAPSPDMRHRGRAQSVRGLGVARAVRAVLFMIYTLAFVWAVFFILSLGVA